MNPKAHINNLKYPKCFFIYILCIEWYNKIINLLISASTKDT